MKPESRRASRAGFTLTEVMIVMLVVGILAAIAMPQLQDAINRARAASLLAEVSTIRLAAHEALAQDGSFPPQRGWGTVPDELAEHLPDNYSFNRGDLRFRWRLFPATTSPYGLATGRLGIRVYDGDRRVLDALALMGNNQQMVISSDRVHFWILP